MRPSNYVDKVGKIQRNGWEGSEQLWQNATVKK